VKEITWFISKDVCPKLLYLDVRSNPIEYAQGGVITPLLRENPNLSVINGDRMSPDDHRRARDTQEWSWKQFGRYQMEAALRTLPRWRIEVQSKDPLSASRTIGYTHIRSIDFSYCGLTCFSLATFSSARFINLSFNNLKKLNETLSKPTSLELLDLRGNASLNHNFPDLKRRLLEQNGNLVVYGPYDSLPESDSSHSEGARTPPVERLLNVLAKHPLMMQITDDRVGKTFCPKSADAACAFIVADDRTKARFIAENLKLVTLGDLDFAEEVSITGSFSELQGEIVACVAMPDTMELHLHLLTGLFLPHCNDDDFAQICTSCFHLVDLDIGDNDLENLRCLANPSQKLHNHTRLNVRRAVGD
jgi:hypothetical protein